MATIELICMCGVFVGSSPPFKPIFVLSFSSFSYDTKVDYIIDLSFPNDRLNPLREYISSPNLFSSCINSEEKENLNTTNKVRIYLANRQALFFITEKSKVVDDYVCVFHVASWMGGLWWWACLKRNPSHKSQPGDQKSLAINVKMLDEVEY